MDTGKTLRSVLLGDWVWPEAAGTGVIFKEGGKGGLLCGDWPEHWIAAEFEWKPVGDSASTLEQVVDFVKDFEASLDIEMTLTKRVMPEAKDYFKDGFNEQQLTDAAFKARTYKVQLAKKIFVPADLSMYELRSATPPPADKYSYGMCIVFDKSPYPPAEEWRQDTGGMWEGAKGRKFWEYRDFYQETEESRAVGRGDEAERAERKRAVLERAAGWRREREAKAAQEGVDASSAA